MKQLEPARYFILDGEEMVPASAMEWAQMLEDRTNAVKYTILGDTEVSTVFLGIDHSFGFGDPLFFETMIFGGENDEFQFRTSTYDEAVRAHNAAVMALTLTSGRLTNAVQAAMLEDKNE